MFPSREIWKNNGGFLKNNLLILFTILFLIRCPVFRFRLSTIGDVWWHLNTMTVRLMMSDLWIFAISFRQLGPYALEFRMVFFYLGLSQCPDISIFRQIYMDNYRCDPVNFVFIQIACGKLEFYSNVQKETGGQVLRL